jgi:site-specific recombinase XerD
METSLEHFFTSPKTISKCSRGPIAGYLEQYAHHLHEQGYARQTGRHHLAVLGAFNEWLDKRNLDAAAVTAATAQRYLQWRWRRPALALLVGQVCRRRDYESAILARLLELIHPALAKAPQPATRTAAEQVVAEYRRWLEQERGLAQATVVYYLAFARKFVTIQFPEGEVDFGQLTPDRITDYIRQQAQQMAGSLRIPLLVTALRSFLRHLLQSGLIQTDLAVCVPAVATWSLSEVPKYLSPEQVQKVIDGCDRNRAGGKRNYAILLLLARLGLRASEIVALTLDDLDWETGLITLHGKGHRVDQLPLPIEVGEAIAEYVQLARPACGPCRRVFIRNRAPWVGLANSIAICSLVDRALRQAGVESVRRGSHVFRHSLATRLINSGSSLPEIGEVLRHRHPDTTRIYAKVDLTSLRTIALPWPGGNR